MKFILYILKPVILLTFFLNTYANDYSDFKKLFDNYFDKNKIERDISANKYISSILRNDNGKEFVYSLGKIENYKGLDLFLVKHQYSYSGTGYEDIYGIEPSDYVYILVFENGSILNNKLLGYIYNQDEAVIFNQDFEINNDTTISISSYLEECCNLTGYSTPFIKDHYYRYIINNDGVLEVSYDNKVELSSPFYDISKISLLEYDAYPVKENPTSDLMKGYSSNIIELPFEMDNFKLIFYADNSKNNTCSLVFETFDKNNNRIDLFVINNTSAKRKCKIKDDTYITIKISDDQLLINPKGKFFCYTKK